MVGNSNTIDFGTVFVNGNSDIARLTSEFAKAVQVNGDVILEDGAYKHRQFPADRPVKLRVTVEIVGA